MVRVKQITLEQFVESERQRLVAFEAQWREAMKLKPAFFPGKLEAGQWDEMFHAFDESKPMVSDAPEQPSGAAG